MSAFLKERFKNNEELLLIVNEPDDLYFLWDDTYQFNYPS